MGGWGWLWLALIVLVIVLLVVWVRRRSGPGDSGPGDRGVGGDDALRILEERFARGEIDRDEFEERRRALRGGPP